MNETRERGVKRPSAADLEAAANAEPELPIGYAIPATWLPRGQPQPAECWLDCDGRRLSEADYPELFAVMGNHYGDGREFRLPDWRRAPDGPHWIKVLPVVRRGVGFV